jgi:hypothetical protein
MNSPHRNKSYGLMRINSCRNLSRHERQHQAEKQGQSLLSDFSDSIKVIEQGNRNRAEASKQQGRSHYYIDKHPIQQPLEQKPYHKGHRYLFTFWYDGQQPILGADSVSRFGKYRTIPKARFNYHEDKAIIFTLPHSFAVWITHPKGSRTAEELVEARQAARRVAQSFSRKHGIAITSEKQAGFSEHTVENKPLDNLIRPLPMEEPELAKEELGLSINQTSHRNKVEWTGKSAKERVMILERLLDADVLEKIDTIEQGVGALSEGQGRIMKELERRRVRKAKPEVPTIPYEGGDYV